jgi:peptide/nickel transport system permease protein
MTTAIEQSMNDQMILDEPPAPPKSRRQEFWSLLRKNKLALWGLATFVIFFILALGGLVLTAGTHPIMDPSMVRLQEKLRPPMARPNLATLKPAEIPAAGIYVFGTDDLGRDVFARMLQGAWVSLTVGFVAVGISVLIGIFMGGVAGYFGEVPIRIDQLIVAGLLIVGIGLLLADVYLGGIVASLAGLLGLIVLMVMKKKSTARRGSDAAGLLHKKALSLDTLIMRFVDIMLCFPSFFLILTVIAILPASIYNIMIVIGLTSWMVSARLVRAEFLSLREQDFVAAARALGVGNFRIIFRHMMPNAMGPVLVSATIGIASAILTEAGLSFLGFGVPPPHATWGNVLSDGRRFIFDAPWLTFIPGMAILIVVLAFNLFGEGLRDVMNPKLRERN